MTIAKDWFGHLGLDAYCCTFVRDLDQREAMLRIGCRPEAVQFIRSYQEVAGAFKDPALRCVVANRLGDWTLLIERNSAEGLENSLALSMGTEVIVAYLGLGPNRSFRYLRDGIVLTAFEDGDLGHLFGWGAEPDLLEPLLATIEPKGFQDFDDDRVPPDLELACLVAGLQPQPEDFVGPVLCADLPRPGRIASDPRGDAPYWLIPASRSRSRSRSRNAAPSPIER